MLSKNMSRRSGPPHVSLAFPVHGMEQSVKETDWLGICIVESQSGWREKRILEEIRELKVKDVQHSCLRSHLGFQKSIGRVITFWNSLLHCCTYQLIARQRVDFEVGLTTKFNSGIDVTSLLTEINARFNCHRVLNQGHCC